MKSIKFVVFGALLFAFIGIALSEDTDEVKSEDNDVEVDKEKLEYAKGSLCVYCDYCKVRYCLYYRSF